MNENKDFMELEKLLDAMMNSFMMMGIEKMFFADLKSRFYVDECYKKVRNTSKTSCCSCNSS